MTTDFFITVRQKIGIIEQVRTLKLAKDLQSERTLQKLEIERQYWQSRNINWGIVTEHEIPEKLARNIDWVHAFLNIEDFSSISEAEIRRITTALTLRVVEEHESLASIAADCDDKLGLEPGIALCVAHHLIAKRWWLVDMNKSINPSEPLVLLANPLVQLHQKLGGVG